MDPGSDALCSQAATAEDRLSIDSKAIGHGSSFGNTKMAQHITIATATPVHAPRADYPGGGRPLALAP
jgi:hypothetical protein